MGNLPSTLSGVNDLGANARSLGVGQTATGESEGAGGRVILDGVDKIGDDFVVIFGLGSSAVSCGGRVQRAR